MYKIEYLKGKKLVGSAKVEYETLEEAQDAVQDHDIWNYSTKCQIIDTDTDEIEYEEDFEDGSGIESMMFPDKGSRDGFDVDDFFDKD